MDIKLHHHHDSLFKAAFAHKKVMVDFLTSRLPQETLARIDLSSLRLTNKSFVSKTGRQTHSDLVYAARMDKQEGYIYIVTEHFSEQEEYVPLRQLEYNLPLMRQHLNEGHKKLPLILNICVYNGTNPYKGPITLLEMFEYPELTKQYLLAGYHLVDLRADTEARIQQDKQATLVELLLKQGKLRDFYNWIDDHLVLLNDGTIPYAEEGFHYILSVDPREDILEKLEGGADPKTKDKIMSAAQRLIQQGMQQGMQQEKLEIAKNMLFQLHLGMDIIQKATSLSREELEEIQAEEK
jgi:predicted transposase/invertase (TIGR01784 family)